MKFSKRLYRRLELKIPDCDSIYDNSSSILAQDAVEYEDARLAKAILISFWDGPNHTAIQLYEI